jgi:Fe-S cluster assembly iron-binding protein IscA
MENTAKTSGAFSVSESAAEKFKEIIDSMEERPAGVRIFNAAGCCGSSVQMELAADLQPGEVQIHIEEVPFFVASDFLPELNPVTIDFADGGFRLLGFQRSGGCGCG